MHGLTNTLKPDALPARILPTISGDWTDTDTMIFRLARTDETAIDTEYETIKSALLRLKNLKYITTRKGENGMDARLTRAGEDYLNRVFEQDSTPRPVLAAAAQYIVHALRLKGYHIGGPAEAIRRNLMTEADWSRVLVTFKSWT